MKLDVVFFARQIQFGRGFATQVIDLSQAKHRQNVVSMDLNEETGVITVVSTEQMGIMNKVPRKLRIKEWVHCIESVPDKAKKDA